MRRWGDDTLDYFALRRDKNYFFSADGQSLIAYLYVRGTAMVAADPIGPPGNEARTLDEFLAFCAERGWRVAFFAVREADADLYRDRGMHVIYLGDEAILQLRQLHPRRGRAQGRAGGGQTRRERPHLRADRRERGRAGAGRRAQRDLRGMAQRRPRARLHDGARRGRRGDQPRLRARVRPRPRLRAGRRLPPLRPRLRRRPGLLARPDAPPPDLDQRDDRVPDRSRRAGARRPRLQAPVAELRRLGTAARLGRGRRPLRPPAAADGERPEPVLPDPEPARLQPEVRARMGAALGA